MNEIIKNIEAAQLKENAPEFHVINMKSKTYLHRSSTLVIL